jgi:hypothetical protein
MKAILDVRVAKQSVVHRKVACQTKECMDWKVDSKNDLAQHSIREDKWALTRKIGSYHDHVTAKYSPSRVSNRIYGVPSIRRDIEHPPLPHEKRLSDRKVRTMMFSFQLDNKN